MTDEELVARAVHANWYEDDIAPTLDYERSRGDALAVQRCERLAAAVVAALREAGSLVPEGCVATRIVVTDTTNNSVKIETEPKP